MHIKLGQELGGEDKTWVYAIKIVLKETRCERVERI